MIPSHGGIAIVYSMLLVILSGLKYQENLVKSGKDHLVGFLILSTLAYSSTVTVFLAAALEEALRKKVLMLCVGSMKSSMHFIIGRLKVKKEAKIRIAFNSK